MCGTGFFLTAFLEAGADIDGLDSSPYMLSKCQEKLKGKTSMVNLSQQRLEELSLPRKYHFIFIPDRSFSHLYDKETAQASLRKLWEYLLTWWLVHPRC